MTLNEYFFCLDGMVVLDVCCFSLAECQCECFVILMEYNAQISVIIQCLHSRQNCEGECYTTLERHNSTWQCPFSSSHVFQETREAGGFPKGSGQGHWVVLNHPVITGCPVVPQRVSLSVLHSVYPDCLRNVNYTLCMKHGGSCLAALVMNFQPDPLDCIGESSKTSERGAQGGEIPQECCWKSCPHASL